MNDSTKSHGFKLQRNFGIAIRFEDIETDIGRFLPIKVVVLVFLGFFSGIKIDSKSKTNRLIKSSWSSMYWISNESSFSQSVFRSWYTFFGYICLTRSLKMTKWRSKFQSFGNMYRKLDSGKPWRVHGYCLRNNYDFYIVPTKHSSRCF